MKVGDRLYCLKKISGRNDMDDKKKRKFFIKNKIYIISNIGKNNVYLSIIDEENESWDFMITDQWKDRYQLKDYFISEKELRKLKLQKLYQK